MRKFVGMTIREELINRLDGVRGDIPRSRVIDRLLEQHLNSIEEGSTKNAE